jgi:hypothetical protein
MRVSCEHHDARKPDHRHHDGDRQREGGEPFIVLSVYGILEHAPGCSGLQSQCTGERGELARTPDAQGNRQHPGLSSQ